MINTKELYIAQLDSVIQMYSGMSSNDSRVSMNLSQFITSALAAIDRITGRNSAYSEQARSLLAANRNYHSIPVAMNIYGIIKALRNNVENGFIDSLKELIHGEVFSDFLEMADSLLNAGYKDAATVIGGGVLESHLRQLCIKAKLDIEDITEDYVRPKKAERLNSDLARAGEYPVLDQKNVTAWLDLRNKAAHAKYDEYKKEQVGFFLAGIRDFLNRHPA